MNMDPRTPRCQKTAKTVADAILELAREKAEGGNVSYEELERIANAVVGDGMLEHYRAVYVRCHSSKGLGNQTPHRTQFLGRVVTQPLEPLLFATPPVITRDLLPNFFLVVRNLIGNANYDRLEAEAHQVYYEILERLGSSFAWEPFHRDPRIVNILVEALAGIAQAFDSFSPRREWFIQAMNDDPLADLGAPRGPEFGQREFTALMIALMRPVHPQSAGQPHRDCLESLFRPSDRQAVDTLVGRLVPGQKISLAL